MTKLIERLKNLFQHQDSAAVPPQKSVDDAAQRNLTDASLCALMHQIQLTKDGEYTCAETADLLDEYVELVADRQDAAHLLPLVKSHLDHCADCDERYKALLRIVSSDE